MIRNAASRLTTPNASTATASTMPNTSRWRAETGGAGDSELDIITVLAEQLRARRQVDTFGDCVLHDDGAGADQRLRRQRDRVPQRRIHADERIGADAHVSGHDDVRRDEAVVLDH